MRTRPLLRPGGAGPHRRWRRAGLVAVTAGALMVAGVAPVDAMTGRPDQGVTETRADPATTTAAATAAAQVAAVPTPELRWRPCRGGPTYDCARVRVPLDYDRPEGATVSLAVTRRRADDPRRRIGSLFFNPGGPGGSGVDEVLDGVVDAVYSPRLRRRFDVIGFDPRGIARSTPVQCFPSPRARARTSPSVEFPYTRAQVRRQVAADRALSRACAVRAGAILDHMATANVARDLELLRRAVGDRRLTYAGYSYGSYLGETYANLFPDRVRAVVLDSVVDPVAWATGRRAADARRPVSTRLGSPDATSETFAQFLDLCARAGTRCAFSAGDPAERFEALTRRLLRSGPIVLATGEGGRVRVTYQRLVGTVLSTMYEPRAWPVLARLVDGLATGHRSRAAAALAVLASTDAPAGPDDQGPEGELGVICSDGDHATSSGAWATAGRRSDRRAPYFGRPWAWRDSACARWPGRDGDRYAGPFDTPTAHPLLLVSNRYDPATPYAGAVRAARLLPGSRLLTVDGWGHISAGKSACADRYTDAYLITGAMPPAGAVCAADDVPFAKASPSRTGRAAPTRLRPPR